MISQSGEVQLQGVISCTNVLEFDIQTISHRLYCYVLYKSPHTSISDSVCSYYVSISKNWDIHTRSVTIPAISNKIFLHV